MKRRVFLKLIGITTFVNTDLFSKSIVNKTYKNISFYGKNIGSVQRVDLGRYNICFIEPIVDVEETHVVFKGEEK